MDREEKDIFDFMNKLSEEESIRLLEKIDVDQYQLSEEQTERIKDNVFAKISNIANTTNKTNITSVTNTTRRERLLSKKCLLAAGLIAILAFGIFTPMGHRTLAEIIKKIYYLPGSGAVEEEKQSSIFILSHAIRFNHEGSELIVHSIIKNTEGMTVKLSGYGGGGIDKLTIVDEKGIKYTSSMSSYGVGYGWAGIYYFYNLPENLISFKMRVSGNRMISINLKKAESHKDYRSIGPTAVKNNLGLTIAPIKDEGKIKFEIIEHPSLNRNVELYGNEDKGGYSHINVFVKDKNGGVYPVEYLKTYMGTMSEFYFKPSNKYESYSVEIPQIRMHYKIDEQILLNIPKDGEAKINKVFNMEGFKFKIDRILRQSNKVRVYVDNYYDINKPENLSRVNLDIKGPLQSYSWKYDDDIIAGYYEFEVAPEDDEIQIKFTDMYTILKGPWKFNFTVK
jgi:hypothetical protein